MDQERGDVGRTDPADPAGLSQGDRPDALELLAGLGAKLGDRLVVEVGGDGLVLQPAEPFDLLALPTDVAVVLGLDADLFDDVGGEAMTGESGVELEQRLP